MAATKITKTEDEIVKLKAKIAESQAKLKELEQRKTELENTEIVEVVRGMSIPLDELAMLLQSLRDKSGTVLSSSGRNVQKPVPAPKEAKEGGSE